MIKLFGTILFLIPIIAFSQPGSVIAIFEKFAREKGFSSISMLEPTPFYARNSEMSIMIDGIQQMKIIKYNPDKSDSKKGNEFINELKKVSNIQGYQTNLHIIDENIETLMLIK